MDSEGDIDPGREIIAAYFLENFQIQDGGFINIIETKRP